MGIGLVWFRTWGAENQTPNEKEPGVEGGGMVKGTVADDGDISARLLI